MPAVLGGTQRDLRPYVVDDGTLARRQRAVTLGAGLIALGGGQVATVGARITTGGRAGTQWANLAALARTAIAQPAREFVHSRVATLHEITIARLLIYVGSSSVCVRRSLVGIRGRLVAV